MTTVDPRPGTLEELARRLTRLEDRARIQDLVAAYAIAVDDHDIETLLSLFTEDGEFERAGSVAHGHEEIREFYVAAMDRYSLTLHSPLSDQICVDGDTARGLLTGRAELALDGTLVMAAYRYSDEYVRDRDRWLFRRRSLRFMYAVPFEKMNAGLCTTERIQWPGTHPQRADFPESLPTWSTYR
ncbi:nuclear transport factor 2 family protein [Rhodococcus ruber]|uniref:Uncharacterized protein n=1 Tax=Rhodococcus ruber TaxID=1830 RepID=A0A098BK05_9NOCA|nr:MULTISPECIES: nuclear transport factor 2 family protein [Rhodococcus]MDO2377151.1 nuclear transport factor 2 family protein [Rhodococcus ruber]MDX5455457.1 nuclear transport factor 2 family protein [Rhodococcus sp. (in: high G+C Gram-positive bacteria)]RIK03895.1 MAG: nuclear transport factor 2 family protein [Acidobacteriota bacterium]AWH01217.1 nuclear transport factor 2 family protein [Rhodococcus ruber]AXY54551.1 hypothetical protein YT1_5162 [Rhodococcus ruber]